jgi:HSP20 family molecular chaperone IbpA
MEMPGIKEEDIHLTLEGNALSISGERKIENDCKPDRYQRVATSTTDLNFSSRFSAQIVNRTS